MGLMTFVRGRNRRRYGEAFSFGAPLGHTRHRQGSSCFPSVSEVSILQATHEGFVKSPR
jgi:Na+/H+-dicarboxylate symporter